MSVAVLHVDLAADVHCGVPVKVSQEDLVSPELGFEGFPHFGADFLPKLVFDFFPAFVEDVGE